MLINVFGMIFLILCILEVNNVVLYWCFINFNILLLFDCKGIWKCGMNVCECDIYFIILFVSKLGLIDEIW